MNKKISLICFACFLVGTLLGQTAITKRTPDGSAELDITGDGSKGLLLPRITAPNSNSQSPVVGTMKEGVLIFNTSTTFDSKTVKPGFTYWADNKWNRMGYYEDMAKSVVASHTANRTLTNLTRPGNSSHSNVTNYTLFNPKIISGLKIVQSNYNAGGTTIPYIILPKGVFKIEIILNMTSPPSSNSGTYSISAGVNGSTTNMYNMGLFMDTYGYKFVSNSLGGGTFSGSNIFGDTRIEKSTLSAINTTYSLSFVSILNLVENETAVRFTLGRRDGSMHYGDVTILQSSKVILTKID